MEQWKKEDAFGQSLKIREGAPEFIFFEGPPSANGMPGIHHVMARSIKDAICRYKTQTGHKVARRAGWDTHGLPVEIGVEKKLGIHKEDIGKTISVEEYNDTCRKEVMKYTKEWVNMTERIGYWVDMNDPYITYDNRYIETLWYLLRKIYDKGLLYKGFSIQPYSPSDGTGLSSHELNQPGCYKDVTDTTVTCQFEVIKDERSQIPTFLQRCVLTRITTENHADTTITVKGMGTNVVNSTSPLMVGTYAVADTATVVLNNGAGFANGKVSVANFAKVVKGLGPVTIKRENQTRVVTISANLTSEVNAYEVENKIKKGISDSFIIPDNISVSYEGAWKDMQDQGKAYAGIILMAILLVFGVMAGTYESFKAPFINLCTIPFLIIGVVAIYKISGQAISMMSAVGLIMLVGIVVNNGIILVDYTNLLLDRGLKMHDACLEAGSSRLRPVLMTTLTTILGMLPMCFASSGSAGMVQPIGVAVVGGLTSSTFITLFFIPVLYSLIMKEKKTKKSRIKVFLTE